MMPQANPIRVFVIDDHEVVQQGIAALSIQQRYCYRGQITVWGTGNEIFAETLQPDIVLLDIRLQNGEDGLSLY